VRSCCEVKVSLLTAVDRPGEPDQLVGCKRREATCSRVELMGEDRPSVGREE
jgi:hypothetical protein